MLNVRTVFDLINEQQDREFLAFAKIANKLSTRPDLHAFMLLDKLVPNTSDLVSAAEHDIIYLDVDLDKLGEVATEQDILDLYRCGINYDSEFDCLYSFV